MRSHPKLHYYKGMLLALIPNITLGQHFLSSANHFMKIISTRKHFVGLAIREIKN
jgi:hypothetical protein